MTNGIGLYPVSLEVVCEGIVGGASLTLNLLVHASDGLVYGSGEITQALEPPYGNRPISSITGQILHTGFGEDERLVLLRGTYWMPGPPTMPYLIECPVIAGLVVDAEWSGTGSFHYGQNGSQVCKKARVTKIRPKGE